ncbi:accessory gene regulator B family protein [Paenibacillus sp. RUD330]|uniref:accessory gene regulator B family protein n=1 Tax=Paenibacillus sp. RUD330 TaxID=2023772 RepID=UPI000B92986B|nr:accessory gene regulator B family protein [Paenibacillus sp. RUD330]ASS64703.1 accessory regulator AgrB [Paenibacillus sp. RUD330]
MNEPLAYKIAVAWKALIPDHPISVPVLKFSIEIFLNLTPIIITTLLLSLLTGQTSEVIAVMIGFGILRQLSGGFHFKSSLQCFIVSTIGITICSLVSFQNEAAIISITLLNIVLFALFAPSNIEGQSRIKKRYYPLLKFLSIIVIVSSLFTNSSEIVTAFFIQGLSLIRLRRKEEIV